MKIIIINFAILFGLMTFSFASAAEDGIINFTNTVKKEVVTKNDKGEKVVTYIDPNLAIPGSTMKYTITFENISDKSVDGIVVNDPLPNNSKYVDGSAAGENTEITFSVDGENFSVPSQLKVKDSTGKIWTASTDAYTHIRWVYKKTLKPGETGLVSFKTKIRKTQVP